MADSTKLVNEFNQEFPKLTARQIWVIVKFCKWVRLRARNNSALNNLLNKMFSYATFKTVTKTKRDGSTYPGLEITVDEQKAEEDDGGDEE